MSTGTEGAETTPGLSGAEQGNVGDAAEVAKQEKMKARPLLAILVILSLLAVVACDALDSLPETCEELAPNIIEMSEEHPDQVVDGRVLKLYDIEAVKAGSAEATRLDRRKLEDELYVLRCSATARTSIADEKILFYLTVDKDGDNFYGMAER